MRILEVTPYYPPSVGGIQYYVQSLSRSLAHQGHAVDVLTVAEAQGTRLTDEDGQNLQIHKCALDGRVFRAVLSREFYGRLFRIRRYDVVHIHVPFHTGLETAVLAAKFNRIPLVATHHGQEVRGTLLYTLLAKTYNALCHNVVLRGVDKLVFLTESYADALELPRAVRNKRCIVGTGADVERFNPEVSGLEVLAKMGVESGPVFMFVGSLHEANRYKGVDNLLNAFVKVLHEIPTARLVIVGDGGLRSTLEHLAMDLALWDRVVFTGTVKNEELPRFYGAADVLVLPSIHGPENSPIVVFEAMASGVPVVASDLPGVRDIVREGHTGRLVKPRDIDALAASLIELGKNADLRMQMGKHARHFAEGRSWAACAEHMLGVFQQAVSK